MTCAIWWIISVAAATYYVAAEFACAIWWIISVAAATYYVAAEDPSPWLLFVAAFALWRFWQYSEACKP
jgi:hypothetical protein